MKNDERYLPPGDREEYVSKVDEGLSDISPARDVEGNIYEDDMPMSYSGFPDSLFLFGRLMTLIALIIGFPSLVISFSKSIAGYSTIFIAYLVLNSICKSQGYRFSRY